MKQVNKTIGYVTAFAIAMGFLESAVVIYLRELYYKEGFSFPLKPMSFSISLVEILREAATVIMLIATGYLAGKNKLQRFAYFSLAFGVWDLLYYVFLYLFLGWPESLFTWDILFLIPLPWVGPVWAPCLLSLLMITGALFVIVQCDRQKDYRVAAPQWVSLITGAVICILAFMWDFLQYHYGPATPQLDVMESVSRYEPLSFNLALFLLGLTLMSIPVFYTIFSSLKIKRITNR